MSKSLLVGLLLAVGEGKNPDQGSGLLIIGLAALGVLLMFGAVLAFFLKKIRE